MDEVPFKEGVKALFKNKYWMMMTRMLALFFLMYSVNGGSTVYYAKDILGDKIWLGQSTEFSILYKFAECSLSRCL